jgi:hypothetical protein
MENEDRPQAGPTGGGENAHAQLVDALDMSLGGFRLVDQGLELAGGGFVHLVGVDGQGRLSLVLLVSESDEETVSRGLEALELANEHGAVVRRHVARGENGLFDPQLAPRLLLVGEAFVLARIRRLATFCAREPDAVLLELRILRSARGESLYLHRLAGSKEPRAAAEEPIREVTPPRAAVRAPEAPAPVRSQRGDLLELFTQRLRGLDPNLAVRTSTAGRSWSHQDALFVEARLEMDGTLTVRLEGTEAQRVNTVRELDAFLERVVAAYLRRLGGV